VEVLHKETAREKVTQMLHKIGVADPSSELPGFDKLFPPLSHFENAKTAVFDPANRWDGAHHITNAKSSLQKWVGIVSTTNRFHRTINPRPVPICALVLPRTALRCSRLLYARPCREREGGREKRERRERERDRERERERESERERSRKREGGVSLAPLT
jgi:hypothetical protein